jgi:hypothetical protein
MKTPKDIKLIIEEEWQKLTDEQTECSFRELEERVIKRLQAAEIDLNDYAAEFSHKVVQEFVHSRVKSLDDPQILLGDEKEAQAELMSGNTRVGKGRFIRNDKLTYQHLRNQAGGQP